jgi:hypothetical protein
MGVLLRAVVAGVTAVVVRSARSESSGHYSRTTEDRQLN